MTKSSLQNKTRIILALIFCYFLLPYATASAQVTITQTQDLSFGEFGFVSFNNVLQINIRNNGAYNANTNTIVYTAPTRAEFTLTGGPANTNFTVMHDPTFILTGPGNDFNIDNIRIRPNTLRTNAAGTDTFRMMARIRSLGGGANYGNGSYSGDIDLIISF